MPGQDLAAQRARLAEIDRDLARLRHRHDIAMSAFLFRRGDRARTGDRRARKGTAASRRRLARKSSSRPGSRRFSPAPGGGADSRTCTTAAARRRARSSARNAGSAIAIIAAGALGQGAAFQLGDAVLGDDAIGVGARRRHDPVRQPRDNARMAPVAACRWQRDDRAALRRPVGGAHEIHLAAGQRRYCRPCAVSALTCPVRSTSSAELIATKRRKLPSTSASCV